MAPLVVKDGDVVVPILPEQDIWYERGMVSISPTGQGVLLWNVCTAGWIASVAWGTLDNDRFRLATAEEREAILREMVGKEFEEGPHSAENAKRYAYWNPIVYDAIIKPMLDEILG